MGLVYTVLLLNGDPKKFLVINKAKGRVLKAYLQQLCDLLGSEEGNSKEKEA